MVGPVFGLTTGSRSLLLVTIGGSGSRLVLLSRTGVFAALGGFSFAVKGISLSLSWNLVPSLEISCTGGNVASPSFGETFRTKTPRQK